MNTKKTIKKKILIIDDDFFIRDIYATALNSEGFEVITAENGEEGLQKVFDKTPDLILLDILMPVEDGLTMLQKLREKNNYGKNVPVILLTNLSAGNEDIVKKIAETEPVYYIVKSTLTPQQVVLKVKEIILPN